MTDKEFKRGFELLTRYIREKGEYKLFREVCFLNENRTMKELKEEFNEIENTRKKLK